MRWNEIINRCKNCQTLVNESLRVKKQKLKRWTEAGKDTRLLQAHIRRLELRYDKLSDAIRYCKKDRHNYPITRVEKIFNIKLRG